MRRIIYLMLLVGLTSCYKAQFHRTTHPTQGKVDVVIDESLLPDDVVLPKEYKATLNGVEVTVKDGKVDFGSPLDPGDYTVYVYNNPVGVNIENNSTEEVDDHIVASVPTDDAVGDDVVVSHPEHLFFGKETFGVTADSVIIKDVSMEQITRDLYFDLTVMEGDTDKIESIDATLDGVAQHWDCINNVAYGDAAKVKPGVSLEEVSANAPMMTRVVTRAGNHKRIRGFVRLLGVNGKKQHLTLLFHFADGNSQSIDSDISAEMTDFNTDKKNKKVLTGKIHILTAVEGESYITDWVSGGDFELDADFI